MKELLKELVETPGVSGDEGRVREKIIEEVEDHADAIEQDGMGNLIVRRGSGDSTLMIAAHMDQIGLCVKRITEEGFLKVSKVGGIHPRNLMDQNVMVHGKDNRVQGIVSAKPIHIIDSKDRKKVPDMEDVIIDIGAESKEEAREMGVRVGDYITFDKGMRELGNDYVTAPAFDDRVGCLVAIEALKRFDEDFELVVVFNGQEEVGRKGAQTSSFQVDPDAAIAVDVTVAGDSPFIDNDASTASLGGGFGIDLIQNGGRGFITPRSMKDWLVETAESNEHDYQLMVDIGGATEAGVINLVREGIPSASLAVPARNIHSSVEVVKLSDIEDAIDFLDDAFSTFSGSVHG
ncbi:MAG: M42 family metallopeptidase [Candidatus Nanohaloarchaea archaeon]